MLHIYGRTPAVPIEYNDVDSTKNEYGIRTLCNTKNLRETVAMLFPLLETQFYCKYLLYSLLVFFD